MERVFAVIEAVALAVWVGALCAFAFVFAPISFRFVTDLDRFGALIGAVLGTLNVLGYTCGAVALLAVFVRARDDGRLSRASALRALIVVAMLAIVVVEAAVVMPAMHAAAASFGGSFAAAAPGDPARARYDRLHGVSSALYGVVLVLGFAAIALCTLAHPGDSGPARLYRR
jgi:hypothetical protein